MNNLVSPALSRPERQSTSLNTLGDIENLLNTSTYSNNTCYENQHADVSNVELLELHRGSVSMDDINLLKPSPASSMASLISGATADMVEGPL